MIDRKTFWTMMAIVVAMLAAAAWRISLLPDWTHLPRYGANGVAISPVSSAILLVMPGGLLFTMARLTWRARTARDTGESLRPWKKWAIVAVLPASMIVMVLQAFIITRSMGILLSVSPVLVSRVVMVVMGLLSMVISNAVPKLPWLGSRISFLDMAPDKGARFQRFQGWLGVIMGSFVVLGGLILPVTVISPIVFSMVIAGMIVGVIFRFSGRRGQPQ